MKDKSIIVAVVFSCVMLLAAVLLVAFSANIEALFLRANKEKVVQDSGVVINDSIVDKKANAVVPTTPPNNNLGNIDQIKKTNPNPPANNVNPPANPNPPTGGNHIADPNSQCYSIITAEGCNTATLDNTGFTCTDNQPPPGDGDYVFASHSVIFNDPVGFMCQPRGGNTDDHLFNTMRLSPNGQYVFTTEYAGSSMFKLSNNQKSVAADKTHDLHTGCSDPNYSNPNYELCQPGEYGIPVGTMDCGGARMRGGIAVDDYYIADTMHSRDARLIFKANADNYDVFLEITYDLDYNAEDVIPREGGGYVSFLGNNNNHYENPIIVTPDNKIYVLEKASASTDAEVADIKVYDFTNPGSPTVAGTLGTSEAAKTMIRGQSTPIKNYATTDENGYVFGLYYDKGAGQVKVYDYSDPLNIQILDTFTTGRNMANRDTFITNAKKIGDTVYYIDSNVKKVFKHVIGSGADWQLAANLDGTVRNLKTDLKITSDHKLFRIYQGKLSMFDLSNGEKLIDSQDLPPAFADFGARTREGKFVGFDVTPANNGDGYFVYIVRGETLNGGPNTLEYLEIRPDTQVSSFQSDVCIPVCRNNMCGQSDGCGGYCDDGPYGGERYDACSNPDFYGCQPYWHESGRFDRQPSCQCRFDLDNDQCTPGETRCEYKEYGGGGWGLCPVGDDIWRVDRQLCAGPSSSCSRWIREPGAGNIECGAAPTNCTYIGN